jgi:hypothetical protein
MNDERPVGALDAPDSRDYIAEQILGKDDAPLPESVRLELTEGDQGKSSMCTCFSAYHSAQVANEAEHNKELDPLFDKGWELQGKFGTRVKEGDYVQTALKSIVKNGLHTSDGIYKIDGYARIPKSEVNYWLSKGFAIVTSMDVTKTNFKKAKHEGIWGGNDGDRVGGHAVCITGYKPFYKIVSNSWGSTWGKFNDGTFLVKNEDVKWLGSCYVLYDHKDIKYIFKDVTEESPFAEAIQWAKDNEIVHGYGDGSFLPEKAVTRAEMVQILHNYSKYLTK